MHPTLKDRVEFTMYNIEIFSKMATAAATARCSCSPLHPLRRKRPRGEESGSTTATAPTLPRIPEGTLPQPPRHTLTSAQFHRVFAASRCHPKIFEDCFVTAAYILYRRYLARVCEGDQEDATSPPLTLAERLQVFVVAYLVAIKVVDDECLYTRDLAGYLSPTRTEETLSALIACETVFCEALRWDLHIPGEAFEALANLRDDEVIQDVICGAYPANRQTANLLKLGGMIPSRVALKHLALATDTT